MVDNDRSIQGIKILDTEKRRIPTKHYIFVIEILWNDGTQNCIFRRYSNFFPFQTTLIGAFPVEGGVKDPADRIIPFLPLAKDFFGRETRDVALKRKYALEGYCQELIKLPQHISQSDLVLMFFEPNDEDISNMKGDSSKSKCDSKTRKTSKADMISGPVLLEKYVAIADYEKLGRGQISLIAGDDIEVIDKNDNGWWFVSVEDEQGWVPCSYLEPEGGSQEHLYVEKCNTEEKFICVKKYESKHDDEINLDLGSIVQVLQKGSDGWWQVRYKGKVGWVPRAYLKPAPTTGDDSIESTKIKTFHKTRYRKQSEAVSTPPRRRTVRKKMQDFPRTTGRRGSNYVLTSDYSTAVGNKSANISQGSNVEVIAKDPNGWWYIKVGNEKICIPASIVERRRTLEAINFSQDNTDELHGNIKTILPSRGFQDKENLEPMAEIDGTEKVPDSESFQNKESSSTHQESAETSPEPATAFVCPSEQSTKPNNVYTAIKSYSDDDEGILILKKGDSVQVLQKDDSGWWLAKVGNKIGWVPSNFLEQNN